MAQLCQVLGLKHALGNPGTGGVSGLEPAIPPFLADSNGTMMVLAGAVIAILLLIGAVFIAGVLGLGGILGGAYLYFRKKPQAKGKKK